MTGRKRNKGDVHSEGILVRDKPVELSAIIQNVLASLSIMAILWVGSNILALQKDVQGLSSAFEVFAYRIDTLEEDRNNFKEALEELKEYHRGTP